MGNHQFAPDLRDKSQDTPLSTHAALPDFDMHSLYKGVDTKFPINNAQPNDNVISFNDSIWKGKDTQTASKYRLPEVADVTPTGASTLDGLNSRITEKATDIVQKRMTPEEKKELNNDARNYAKQMAQYEEHMKHVMMGTGGIGLDDPPPNKPASIIKYEKAIDAEIKKIADKIG